MSIFIKTGLWESRKEVGAPKNWFNLTKYIYDILNNNSGNTPIEVNNNTELINLITNNELIPGASYKILNADPNLYGGTEITLTAIASNKLSLQGSGKFYCPKYDVSAESTGYGIWTKQMEGTFSNVVGTFTPNEVVTADNGATAKYLAQDFLEFISGEWSFATSISGAIATADVSGFVTPSYTEGQIVHWGGKSWISVGSVGSSIDKYTLDSKWIEIPFNETDYNVYIDEIHYDIENDMIIYRKDRYNNVVSGSNQVFVEFESPDGYDYGNPIKDFQWGCCQDDFNVDDYFYLGIQGNEIIDSYFETLNTRAKNIWFNKLSQFSYIQNNTLGSNSYINNTILNNSSSIEKNILSNYSSINNNTLSGVSYINNNTLSGGCSIQNNDLSGNSFINNNILINSTNLYNNTLSISSSIQNNIFSNYSSIQNNNLSGKSSIKNNTFSNSGTIQYNTLSNSFIESNTFSNNRIEKNTLSGNSNINNNTLSGNSFIQNNTLSSSSIENNTLNSGSIQYTTLGKKSSIDENTLSGSSVQNTTLSNSQLTFSDEIIGKTTSSLEIKNSIVSIPDTAIIIFNPSLSKTIFTRLDSTPRLQYVNDSDVIVITDVDA